MQSPVVHRRGNAILMALLLMAGIAVLVTTLSDRIAQAPRQLSASGDRLQATYAAESIAAMVEAKLVDRAADLTSLQTDIDQQAGQWWGLKGFWGRRQTPSGETFTTNGGIWINGCLVRWTLEPLRIYAKGMPDVDNPPAASFAVNTPADPGDLDFVNFKAGNLACRGNSTYYHFRIVTEAFTLDPDVDPATATPWATVGQSRTRAQAQRVVQLRLTSLFRYALFYAAEGPEGDLELGPGKGATMTVAGATHSNGAIYLAGGGGWDGTFTPVDGGGALFGTSAAKCTVSSVDGLFRMLKTNNYAATRTPGHPLYRAELNPSSASYNPAAPETPPSQIPITSNVNAKSDYPGMSGPVPDPFQLNGQKFDPATQILTLTPNPITKNNDSRSPSAMKAAFGNALDPAHPVVKTLANMPELGGRPLESQMRSGDLPLYDIDGSDATARDTTIYPANHVGAKLLRRTAGGVLSCDLPGTPVSASELPVCRLVSDPQLTDVVADPLTDPRTASAGTDPRTGASRSEVRGFYHDKSLFTTNGRTGITIRERTAQVAGPALLSLGTDLATARGEPVPVDVAQAIVYLKQFHNPVAGPVLRPTLGDGVEYGSMGFNRFFARYMACQYVVFLGYVAPLNATPITQMDGCVDITNAFFRTIIAAAPTVTADFIAREDQFCDPRGGMHLRLMYGVAIEDPWNQTPAIPYMRNVLTINIGRLTAFVKSYVFADDTSEPSMKSLYPPDMLGRRADEVFNGLVYAARTHRGLTYDPVDHPELAEHWSVNSVAQTVTKGTYALPSWNLYPFLVRDGDGPAPTRMVAVAVENASSIDWGVEMKKVRQQVPTATRHEGLTIATQDGIYVSGDYNTTKDVTNNLPPCAIFADTVTVRSKQWRIDSGRSSAAARDGYYDRYYNYNNLTKVWQNGTTEGGFNPFVPYAAESTYNVSFALCNVPTYDWNYTAEGSGGTHNICRFIEWWKDVQFIFRGSLVCLSPSRYQRNPLAANPSFMSPWRAYQPPRRNINFNTDLLTTPGQPPFSPYGVETTRVVSTIALRDGG